MLFDSKERTDLQPAGFAEPTFEFYNRSARPACEQARELLEKWFALYPDAAKDDLRARFRSSDEHNHAGAFFELYCYTLLTMQGYTVELHPDLSGGKSRHPDFIAATADGSQFYLESTVAAERTHEEEAYLNQLYDYLNRRVRSPDFFLGVSVLGDVPGTMLSLSNLRKTLHTWLSRLDADEVITHALQMQEQRRLLDALPTLLVEQGGWRIEFMAHPVARERRGDPEHKVVGVISRRPTSSWVDMQKPLLPALRKKAHDYGELDMPYVIAINSRDFVDTDDITSALFGKHGVRLNRDDGSVTPMHFPDGLWTAKGGQFSRVSAVLITSLLGPLTVGRQQPMLWHNPWAAYPLDPSWWLGPQMVPDATSGTMQAVEGQPAWEILGVQDLLASDDEMVG